MPGSAVGGWFLELVRGEDGGALCAGADLFLVPASSSDGVLVFLVLPSDAGVRVETQQLTSFEPAGRLVLDGVVLGDDRALGGALGGATAQLRPIGAVLAG